MYAKIFFRFGGAQFSYARMSWIKTNFLWMMYRSGWASKRNQEKVLAVRISRKGFEEILSKALTGKPHHLLGQWAEEVRWVLRGLPTICIHTHTGRQEKEKGIEKSEVRLQWDPDHDPFGAHQQRRAIQLGLRNEVNEWA